MSMTKNGTPRTLAKRLMAAREAAGMSRTELGREAGVSLTRIGSYERSEDKPGTDNLVRLARALGVSVDWLAAGIEVQP